jgi:hypothetical protein
MKKDIDNLINLLIEYKQMCNSESENENENENESETEIMLGSGILDSFIKQDKLKSSSQKILNNYGTYLIVKIQIYRTPVLSLLKSFLNVISLGKFRSATQSYDDLFHLAMIITVKMPDGSLKNIVVEKNATVNISTEYKTNEKTEIKEVDLKGRNLTLKSMIDETLKKIPTKRFYLYDAFNSDENSGNCQRFIMDILASNNLITPELDKFINQNAEEIAKNLGSVGSQIVPKITRAITDLGAVFGAGENDGYALHAVVIKKPVEADELKRIHDEFIKDKNRNFMRMTKLSIRMRNIPKTAFEPKTFRSKKINNKITLIYGKLKQNMEKRYLK